MEIPKTYQVNEVLGMLPTITVKGLCSRRSMMLFTGPIPQIESTLAVATRAAVTSRGWSSIAVSVVSIATRRAWLV